MADTTVQQIANLGAQITNLQGLVAGISQQGVLTSAFGDLNVFGGMVTNELYPSTAITSSSVANPTVITLSAAPTIPLVTGDYVEILSHSGSTPSLNGLQGPITVLTATTFTIPVSVTVGGSGGTARKVTMTLSVNGQNASDSLHWNPNYLSPPIRPYNYGNQLLVLGGSWMRDQVNVGLLNDATWPITTAPGTGYHRYDIVYAYLAPTGPAVGVAAGTAVLNASTPVVPSIPVTAVALAQVHVQSNVLGIISTAITDLRNFNSILQGKPSSVLAKLPSANLNTTADQIITGMPAKFLIQGIYATNCSGSATAAVGGIYTAPSKGGSQVVYAGQSWASLTAANSLLPFSFASAALEVTYGSTLYLSLTTPQGAAMTADIYVIGVALP